MKLFSKVSLLFFAGILFGAKTIAQTPDSARMSGNYFKPFSKDALFRTWSFGVNTGLLNLSNIFESNRNLDFTSPNTKLGYGFYVKKQILPLIGIQGQLITGSLSAQNSQQNTNGDPNYLSVNTSMHYAASINVILNFVNLNWHDNNMGIQPFLGLGFGFMNYHPKLTALDASGTGLTTIDAGASSGTYIPLQFGVKFNVSRSVNIELAYQADFAMTDNVDGNVYGSTNDKFSYFNLGLEFALGKRSKPQMATYNIAPVRHAYVPVKNSKVPKDKTATDKATVVKTVAVTAKDNTVEIAPNHDELNQKLKALSMDTDSDGVSDYFDKCPNTPHGVVVDNAGCPIVTINGKAKAALTEKEKQVISDVMKNIQFENGRSSLNKTAIQYLNSLLSLLVQENMNTDLPIHILIIAGYSDDLASDMGNLSLSRDRAEAIKTYLINKGIKPSNIITVGYGDEKPINSTGEKSGRSVELTLY